MEMLVILTFILVGVLVWKYISSNHEKRVIPGPKGYPVIGSLLHIEQERSLHQFYDFASNYGEIFKVKILGAEIVVLNSTDLIEKAFNKQGHIFNNRGKSFALDYIGLHRTIAFRNPDKEHSSSRKIFTKGLHIYGSGVPRFENIVKGEIRCLMEKIEKYKGQQFEVTRLISRSLVNVMAILLIGEEATDEDANNFMKYLKNSDFLSNGLRNTLLSHVPFLFRLPYFRHKLDITAENKTKVLKKFFHDIKETVKPGDIKGFVQWLILEQKGNINKDRLSDEHIESMVLSDVFGAGVITTAASIPSAILCLVNHPKYQTKLQEEIDRVIGRDRDPTVGDKTECDFIEATVMETLRLLAPGPFLLPHETSEDTELEGYFIKAKTQVFANVWYIHHDENIWGDPWTFRPDRFLDDKGKLLPNDHLYMKSWLPFGTGRRRCVGSGMATSRIFLYICSLFQKFTFLPATGKCGSCDPRSESFEMNLAFTARPFYVVASERK